MQPVHAQFQYTDKLAMAEVHAICCINSCVWCLDEKSGQETKTSVKAYLSSPLQADDQGGWQSRHPAALLSGLFLFTSRAFQLVHKVLCKEVLLQCVTKGDCCPAEVQVQHPAWLRDGCGLAGAALCADKVSLNQKTEGGAKQFLQASLCVRADTLSIAAKAFALA